MKLFFLGLIALVGMAIPVDNSTHEDVDLLELRFRESINTTDHKYYLSVSNVAYSEKAGALQMVSRFFIDDFQDVLEARTGTEVILGNPETLPSQLALFQKYIPKRLTASIDGKDIDPKVIGAEYDADQILLYIELPVAREPNTVELSYKALFELFPDQKNLVHFKLHDKRKSLLNSKDTPVDQVKF
ncbi:DUF6702 family protein [Nonlabens ponticola]|uniref:Uncharacterized protein n=1 Tax=Nonlabens ponticola TaxID=2496866 RepID=A0A3S9MUL1_9FLAO|nr:DUF6702 family protein [Nonlabens ponticola]AZQ42858.1 hypothetical protein EJ995_00880 [Nonlabens ponticola]